MEAEPTRLVVFDLDGTLVDSAQDLAFAVNELLARLVPGTRRLPLTTVRSFIGRGARRLVARSLEAVGLDGPVDEALDGFLQIYGAHLLDTTRLYPGVREALAGLERHRLAVLTNKPGDMSRRILEGLGVAGRFLRVYGGGDLPARKPDPAGIQRLLAETGLPSRQCVMVGDSAVDVQTGRAADCLTVGVRYGFDPEGLAAEAPDHFVDDLRQLVTLLEGPG